VRSDNGLTALGRGLVAGFILGFFAALLLVWILSFV
jgi:tetrahydromethanopterin S-methyltransferase subunit F